MKIIEEFMKRVRQENNSFVIEVPRRNDDVTTYHFILSKVGNAILVYGDYSYYDKYFYLYSDYKPELCAIVTNDMIYVLDEYLFSFHNAEDYPVGVRKYFDYVEEIKKDITNNVFRTYWNDIEVSITRDMEVNEQIKNIVRDCIFYNDTEYRLAKRYDIKTCPIERIDCTKELCGFVDIKKEVIKYFDDNRERLKAIKTEYELIKSLVSKYAFVEDLEMEILNGLNSVDARTVNVTFNFNGKTGTEKIEAEHLKRILRNKDCFIGYDFCNTKKGDSMIEWLGAGKRLFGTKEVLTCEHIEKITFGKKTLYQKH